MISIALELVLIALCYVVITVAIQRKFSNIKRIREIRTELNEHQAHLRKMGKTMSKEELDTKTSKMMELQTEMMRHTFKASLIILPVSLVLFYYLLPLAFPGTQPNISVLSFSFNYRTFFIIAAFIIGMLSQVAVAQYDKFAAKKAEGDMQTVTNNT